MKSGTHIWLATREVIEVAENSADAKKWPVWRPPGQEDASAFIPTSNSEGPPVLAKETSSSTLVASEDTPKPKQPPSKRPGPRKPKTVLPGLLTSQKPKKLTTLDKSAMDWSAHINAEQDSGMKDQLEANRRGGGYLEKVEFLRRVDERKDDVLEANKPNKRRRLWWTYWHYRAGLRYFYHYLIIWMYSKLRHYRQVASSVYILRFLPTILLVSGAVVQLIHHRGKFIFHWLWVSACSNVQYLLVCHSNPPLQDLNRTF